MWEVVVRPELRPLIDALAGKSAGYRKAYEQLQRGPCAQFQGKNGLRPFAYRLSGPLAAKVCGVHLKNGYRLAFSMQHMDDSEFEGRIVVLYVGTRDTRDRSADTWEVVHDLFDEVNPPVGHVRPPCCEDGMPAIGDQEFDDFMRRLRRLIRGR